MPVISVIVPVYKVEPYLRRCADSILGQTFPNFELILVDDGSPDRCGAICDEYAAQDSRVRVIHQQNSGLSAARNAGLDWVFANSDSQWISFIDSDDWVHPQYLEVLFNAVRQNGTDVAACEYERTAGEELTFAEQTTESALCDTEHFFFEHRITATVAWGKLYRRLLFLKLRYPVGKIHEDEFVTYQVLFQRESLAYIPEKLYAYFMNPESIMGVGWSPKRLVALDAFAEQTQWFRKQNYAKLYQWTLQNYVYSIVGSREKVLQMDDVDARKYYSKRLKRRLKGVLLRYRKDLPVSKYHWIYEIAFPSFMKHYWYYQVLRRRIFGKKDEDTKR